MCFLPIHEFLKEKRNLKALAHDTLVLVLLTAQVEWISIVNDMCGTVCESVCVCARTMSLDLRGQDNLNLVALISSD